MPYKLALLVRTDLGMSKGKIVAQTAHAMVEAVIKGYTSSQIFLKWRDEGETIIALKVKNHKTLMTIMEIAGRKNVMAGYIVDAGKTEVAPGTITVGFVGPDTEEKINKLTGQLKCL